MDDSPVALSLTPAAVSASGAPSSVALPLPVLRLSRWFAMLQAFLVCGIPTQLMVAVVLVLFVGMRPFDSDGISLEFFATLSLLDTALVALLIRAFLIMSGEETRDVFIGVRPVRGEILRGLLLLPLVFLAVTGIVLGLRALFPGLHNVQENPYVSFMRTPLESTIFIVVVVLAGGIREEVQRAFILHRFKQRLGGVYVGLVIFSLAFGAFHINEGLDASIAVGLLGLLWGLLYIKRRSAVCGMVNHASFDVAQILQLVIAKALGV
ncbi:MAG: CPBP family intramembrane glutamic endopeptidase [Vicinamibacterales bacterium]